MGAPQKIDVAHFTHLTALHWDLTGDLLPGPSSPSVVDCHSQVETVLKASCFYLSPLCKWDKCHAHTRRPSIPGRGLVCISWRGRHILYA